MLGEELELAEKLIDAVKQDEIVQVYKLLSKNENLLKNKTTVIEFFQYVTSVEMLQLLFQHTEFENVQSCVSSLFVMSLISFAIMHGKSIDIVTEIVKMGEDINAFDDRNRTPLIESLVCYRDVNFIEKLILMGADVNKCDSYFRSPIHFAYIKDIVTLLLKHGAYVNTKDDNGQTPLLRALELNRDKDLILELIEGGGNINCIDQNENSALHLTNDPELFNYFVRNNAAPVNSKNKKGQTPLMKSVKEHRNINMIKVILENGGDPNSLDANSNTPLHYAYNGEVVNLLVSYGGNINARNEYNQTPFHTIFHHRPITFSFGFSSAEAILKHTLLTNDSEIPSDSGYSESMIICNFRILIEVCKAELKKMKEHNIFKNFTFYDFCTFKKTKYNKFINVSSMYFYCGKEEIKELFPNFYDIILMKINCNELDVRKHSLSKKLNQISLKSKTFNENSLTQNGYSLSQNGNYVTPDMQALDNSQNSIELSDYVELDYDTLRCVTRYLNYEQLCNLFRASLL